MLKKILFVISDDVYLISHRLSLIQSCIAAGYCVSTLVKITDPHLKEKIEKVGCTVFDVGYRSKGIAFFGNIKLIVKLIRYFNRIKPDVVHAFSIRMVLLSTIGFYFSKIPKFIGTITGMGNLETSQSVITTLIKNKIYKLFHLLFSSKNTYLIVQNRDDYEFAKQQLIDKKRLTMIRGSGVDIDFFTLQPEPSEPEKVVIAFVSRMLKDKGVHESIDAIKILAKKYPYIQLQLVGDIFLENPLSLTTAQMTTLSDHPNIVWLGHQQDIVAIWKNAHIALLPSYREGLPKSLLEAAACARPIVTTDVPGCREIVIDHINGFLVLPKSAIAIADALEKLIIDSALRKKLGFAGRALVEKQFSNAIVNKEILDFYATL